MVDPVVRLGLPGDVGQLAELEREARRSLIDQRGGARWLATHPARDADWVELVAREAVHVAVVGEVVVGYLVAVQSGEIARIDEVFVTPEARELGFGDALLEAEMARARAAGCVLIEGEALPGDRDTKNLYERAGITARLIVVSRRL